MLFFFIFEAVRRGHAWKPFFFPEAKRVARGIQARGGEGFSLASAVRAVCLGSGG